MPLTRQHFQPSLRDSICGYPVIPALRAGLLSARPYGTQIKRYRLGAGDRIDLINAVDMGVIPALHAGLLSARPYGTQIKRYRLGAGDRIDLINAVDAAAFSAVPTGLESGNRGETESPMISCPIRGGSMARVIGTMHAEPPCPGGIEACYAPRWGRNDNSPARSAGKMRQKTNRVP